jgi:hypothetical protein
LLGAVTLAPTSAILPSRINTEPRSIVAPVTVTILALRMTKTFAACCALATEL